MVELVELSCVYRKFIIRGLNYTRAVIGTDGRGLMESMVGKIYHLSSENIIDSEEEYEHDQVEIYNDEIGDSFYFDIRDLELLDNDVKPKCENFKFNPSELVLKTKERNWL